MIQRMIKKYFEFKTLNREINFHLVKHMMNFDQCRFRILIVKIWETNEIKRKDFRESTWIKKLIIKMI